MLFTLLCQYAKFSCSHGSHHCSESHQTISHHQVQAITSPSIIRSSPLLGGIWSPIPPISNLVDLIDFEGGEVDESGVGIKGSQANHISGFPLPFSTCFVFSPLQWIFWALWRQQHRQPTENYNSWEFRSWVIWDRFHPFPPCFHRVSTVFPPCFHPFSDEIDEDRWAVGPVGFRACV